MGTVRLRLWKGQRVWSMDFIAAGGRRVRQTVGSGDQGKRLARQILLQREAEATLGQHHIPISQTMRFGEFAESWLKRIASRVKAKTLEAYEDVLQYYLTPHFGTMRLGAISRREVESYLLQQTTRTRRGKKGKAVPLAAATVNKSLAVLKLVLREAIEQGFLSESSALRVKYVRNQDNGDRMQILQPEEIERLLQTATGDEPWRTLYLLAVHTGLRRGELLGLHRGDLDAHTRRLYVRRGLNRVREGNRYVVRETPLKTKYSRWMIEDLSPTLIETLLALPASDDPARPYVFLSRTGGPIDPDNVDRAFKRHLDLAGLPEIRFHDLRHTHASLLIAAGVHPKAIQARLGHASITTTLNVYGHLMPSAYEGVGRKLDHILRGPGGGVTVAATVQTLGSGQIP